MVVMAMGGCAGSTSGGIKIVRIFLLARHALQDLIRMIHPRAVLPLRSGEQIIPDRLRVSVLGFFFVYAASLMVGTVALSLHQVPVGAAFDAIFACLNITGIALGPVGEPEFYASLPSTAKLLLSIYMLLGRLEIFSVLMLFSPVF